MAQWLWMNVLFEGDARRVAKAGMYFLLTLLVIRLMTNGRSTQPLAAVEIFLLILGVANILLAAVYHIRRARSSRTC